MTEPSSHAAPEPNESGVSEPVEPAPPATRRRGPHVCTLLVGLLSLLVAAMTLTGWAPSTRWFDLRWVLAGGAVVLGLALLSGTLRTSRNRT